MQDETTCMKKQLRKEAAVHIEFFSQTHYFMFSPEKKETYS